MDVVVRADREGDRARLIPMGQFDLPHAVTAAQAIANMETRACRLPAVELDLRDVDDIDGTGAAQLARLLDRVEARRPQHAGPGRTQPESRASDRPLSPASDGHRAGQAAPVRDARRVSDRLPLSCLAP